MRWFVPVLCGLAVLTALTTGARGERFPGPLPVEIGTHEPSSPAAPAGRDELAAEGPSEELAAERLAGLRATADDVVPLDPDEERRVLEDCLEVPEGADPALSPDPDRARVAASGETLDAAVVVWIGTAPQYETAIGTCTALGGPDGWQIVGRSVRRDLGEGSPSLVWQPAASARGAAAAAVGRIEAGTANVFVVLDDGRVLEHQPTDGFVAIPWQPVSDPVRLVTLGRDGSVTYDGSLSGYSRD